MEHDTANASTVTAKIFQRQNTLSRGCQIEGTLNKNGTLKDVSLLESDTLNFLNLKQNID